MGESAGKTSEISLKDQGNEFFKAGNYLKAAALYTQAIKQDPSNPTLYRYHVHEYTYTHIQHIEASFNRFCFFGVEFLV